jgi:hypothetical protein
MGTMLREETAPTMPHIETLLLGNLHNGHHGRQTKEKFQNIIHRIFLIYFAKPSI